MSYFKKFISGLLVLAAIGFLPKYSFAGTFNIIVNAGSVNLQGDYDKRWSSFDKMGTVDENAFVLRAAFEAEIFKNFFMGAGFSSFGKMKYSSPSSYYAWKKDEDKINLVSEYIKINLIDVPVISDTERFQLYAMAGLGQFFWNKNITYYDKGKSKFYDDSAYANMPGYSLAAGINFVLSDVLMLGTEFRYDSTFGDFDEKGKHFSKIKTTSYQSRSFGVNVGLRFGGNSASYENKNWDTSSQNSFDSQSVISYAEQSDNKGWAPLDDAPAAAESSQKISENTSEDLASDADESPVAAVKKSSSEAMSEISPAAVDYNPEYTELDKDEYLSLMDKIWDQEPVDGKIGIPAMGVLFQIGKRTILPYYNEMLNDFIDLYKNTDGKAKIIIEGYSSNGGNETAKNPKLSQQRAKAVASYMIKEGISKENLEVKAYGNTKTGSGLFANDKGCKGGQCYRRVNVRIAK